MFQHFLFQSFVWTQRRYFLQYMRLLSTTLFYTLSHLELMNFQRRLKQVMFSDLPWENFNRFPFSFSYYRKFDKKKNKNQKTFTVYKNSLIFFDLSSVFNLFILAEVSHWERGTMLAAFQLRRLQILYGTYGINPNLKIDWTSYPTGGWKNKWVLLFFFMCNIYFLLFW